MSRNPDFEICQSFYGICRWCDYTTPESYWRTNAEHSIRDHLLAAHPEASA